MKLFDRLILEGGASGHMSHLFEDYSLTINELKEIIDELLSGKIELHEKTDGMNLVLTYKDGQLLASRNKATLRNPMNVEQLASMFKGEVKTAFVKTMEDMSAALDNLTPEELSEIFNDGHNFMSIEIIYPSTKNVIDYGDRLIIQLHGINKYDDNWNKVGEDKELAKKLYDELQKHDALNQANFTISGPNVLKLTKNMTSVKIQFNKQLDKIIQGYAKDTDTLKTYMYNRWKKTLDHHLDKSVKGFKGLKAEVREKLIDALIDRLAFDTNTLSKSALIKSVPPEMKESFTEYLELLDANKLSVNRYIILPLELLIIRAGTELLSNVSGIMATNPDKSIKHIADELDKAVNDIKRSDSSGAVERLSYYLNKVEKIGKDKIMPLEGVVFIYKGKPYKLTGLFGSINNIVNLMRRKTKDNA